MKVDSILTSIKNKIGTICMVIVCLVGAYVVGTCHGGQTWQQKYKQYYDSTQSVLANSAKLQHSADSLLGIANKKDSTINKMIAKSNKTKAAADSLHKLTDSLSKVVQNIKLPPEVTKLITSLQQENDSLRSIVLQDSLTRDTLVSKNVVLQSLYTTEKERADKAVFQLQNEPKPESNKFLFINLPSRITCLLLGVAAGVLGTVVVTH